MLTYEESRLVAVEISAGVLLAGVAVMTVLSAQHTGHDSWEQLGALGAAAAGYLLGREVARLGRPSVVVGAGLAIAGATALSMLAAPTWSGPESGPLGYTNASAALAVQGAAAAALAIVATDKVALRWIGAVLCAGLCAVPLFNGASGASIGVVVVVGATVFAVSGVPLSGRAFAAWSGIVAFAAVGTTVAIGVAGRAPAVLVSLLTQRRVDLWTIGVKLIRDHPLFGVGPGGFDPISTAQLNDAEAHPTHSLLLNIAAETGVLAAVLLAGVGIAVLVLLARASRHAPAPAVVGIAVWLSFALQSSVDWIADFPQVLIVTAAVIGLSMTEDAE